MPKKACCCNVCEWCNHDHYDFDYFNPSDPINSNNGANLYQDAQPNWKIKGTVTTELPSIGHPMTLLSFQNCSTQCCLPDVPTPVGWVQAFADDSGAIAGFTNTLRTPIQDVETTSYGWGEAPFYGDICPAWFNGINMTNVLDDTDVFFNFTFNLKIEKLTSSGYTTVVNINKKGPGKNLRPHPDACHSYNVNDMPLWELASGCGIFHEHNDNEGNPLPCVRDFARMPRGPWPYKFLPHYDIDSSDLTHCYNSTGNPYTKNEVKKAKAGLIPVNGTYPAESGVGYVESNILQCNLIQTDCPVIPQPGEPNCCPHNSFLYVRGNQYCDRLDPDHGTPFGWEDCPELCAGYSNTVLNGGLVDPTTLNFFGWISSNNRYTTPEWDLYDGISGSTYAIAENGTSRKISLHVLVPSQFDSFCNPSAAQGQGFGEWSFGMDYEAPNEITALENAGYVWSDGIESDGIWIHKTPTNALRVLFTLDHSDLDQGKVWRVFRDWDVTVNQHVKTFNAGTPQETKFRITIKQKVEEIQFSSLGCDCPSGYTITDGKIEPVEPACADHTNKFGPEALYNVCWTSMIDGKYDTEGNLSTNRGGRVSFSERGPLVLKMKAETDDTGCQICNSSIEEKTYPKICDHKFGSRTTASQNGTNADGQLLIVSGPSTNTRFQVLFANAGGLIPNADTGGPSCLGPVWYGAFGACNPSPVVNPATSKFYNINAMVYDLYRDHGSRFNNALADIPLTTFNGRGAGLIRYRSVYNALQQSESSILNELNWEFDDGSKPSYTHIYGDFRCVWNGGSECGADASTPVFSDIYRLASVFIDKWPTSAPVGKCKINCPCGAKGFVSQPEEGQDSQDPTDPCAGWSGPTPCPYYGGWCAGIGQFEQCPCHTPEHGNKDALYPAYGCNTNIVPIYGRGADDIYYKCSPIKQNGEFGAFCDEPGIDHYMGLDSERIYFTARGQVTARTGLGDPGCAKTCLCPNIPNYNSSCYWTDNFGVRRCNFCLSPVTSEIGFGYQLNTFLNWKKYLCRKRYENGYKIPVDIMSNFSWSCDSSATGNCDRAKAGLTTGSACDYGWLLQNCEFLNVPLFSMAGWACDVNQSMNLSPKFRLSLSKYDINKSDPNWCYWDTTYKPNPARSHLPNNRSHIIISAKGPI